MANCPASAGAAAKAATHEAQPPDDDDDEDIDDEFMPTDDEVAVEEALNPEMMLHAQDWDCYRELALRAMRPFDDARGDTEQYRGERALEYFNSATKVVRAMNRHDPESTSAIGNVMVEVVPRMIMAYGDQLKLGSDVSEAYGADLKFTIHKRVVRRRVSTVSKEHKRLKTSSTGDAEEKVWMQTFTRGRVEQAFRHVCLRRRLMTLPAYAHLRMRGHAVVANTGRAALSRHVAKADSPSGKRDMKTLMDEYAAP